MNSFRYRLTFGKGHELRFTGHLDLHRALERTFRRAEVPMAYSEGYNPRPKINIGAALPLGCTSAADLADVELSQDLEVSDLRSELSGSLPPGLTISEIATVALDSPKLQKLIVSSVYVIPLPDLAREDLQPRMEKILSSDEVVRERRGKEYDLRPLIEKMSLAEPMLLNLRLAARSNATGRPDEVLRALELDPVPLVPHRVRLILHGSH